MAFSADAIGFYLQAEDQLSPVLATAASNYDKFVVAMEKANKKAFNSATGALGQVAALVESVEKTPQAIGAAYSQVLKTMKSKAKAFTQPITLSFSSKDRKKLARELAGAVHKAMSGASIRLGATFPARKLGMFDSAFGLRTMYSALTQPPDMKGTFRPKRFAKGGIADGPGKGFDSVLSLLEPGEIVLPKSVSDNLLSMASGLGGAQAADLGESISGIDNLAAALRKMKGAIDAGLGSTEDIDAYQKGVDRLSKEVDGLNAMASDLSYNTKVRLAGAIKGATSQMSDFVEEGKVAQTVFEKLLTKVVGPVRFLALSKGLDSVVASFDKLSNQASRVAGDLEGGGTQSAIQSYNDLNKTLRLTRGELRTFKQSAVESAEATGVNQNSFADGITALKDAGVRSRKELLSMAPALTLYAKSTGSSMDTAAKAVYRLSDAYGFSDGVVAGVLDNLAQYQSKYNFSADELLGGMESRFDLMGARLDAMSEVQGATLLNSMSQLGAAVTSQWGGSVNALPDMMASALDGSVEAMGKARMLFGMESDQLADALARGDTQSVLEGLTSKIQGFAEAGNSTQLHAMMEAMDFSGSIGDFTKLGTETDALRESLQDMAGMTIGPGSPEESLARLTKAHQDSLTTMAKFRIEVSGLASKTLPFLDVSTAEVVDGINDIGPTTILAIGSLAKLGIQSIATSAKMVKHLPGAFGKLKGLMGGLFGGKSAAKGAASAVTNVSKAAGGLSSAASGGGFLAGLASGMTALAGGVGTLGAVLISPPGIAFSVTLIAALLAIAAAARIATPALKVLGGVVETAMGSVVKVFGLAVPIFQTFIKTAGEVFLGTLDRIVEVFKALTSANPANLLLMGPALLSVSAGFGSLAFSVVALGAALGAASVGVGLFRLASGGSALGGGLMGSLMGVLGNMEDMAGPGMIAAAESQVYAAVGFVGAYGVLLTAIDNLPGGGLLSGIFGDDPAEQLREHATSIARAIRSMQTEFRGASSIRQKGAQASFTPAQIDTVINAVAEAGLNDDVRDEMMENNRILRKILGALVSQSGPRAATPQVVNAPARRANPLTQEIGGFGI